MGDPDPREPLPSLEVPELMIDIMGAFYDKPAVVAHYTKVQLAAQVERDRQAKLARLSEATATARAKIAGTALDHDKSKKWMYAKGVAFEGPEGKDAYLPRSNKCNLFVYQMLQQSGVHLPLIKYDTMAGLSERLRPPLAGEWANPRKEIPGFEVLKVPPDVPQPGDVAAIANVSWDATGHVGIVAKSPDGSANWTVSARSGGVGHNDWGFRPENKDAVVFRRYVGPPK